MLNEGIEETMEIDIVEKFLEYNIPPDYLYLK